MTPTASRKAQLLARLADLQGRLVGIEAELEAHNNPDWQERATEREADEVLDTMGQSAQHEMRMIEAALQRIEAGDYGDCARCGTPIAPERLDLLPFTPLCHDCAQSQALQPQGGRA